MSKISLTPGQKYAVDYLTSKGLKFVSDERQLRRGTLMFKDPNDIWNDNEYKNPWNRKVTPISFRHWALYKTGYVRTGDGETMSVRGRIKPPQREEEGFIDDDEYMELAELAARKMNNIRKNNPNKEIQEKLQRISDRRVDDTFSLLDQQLYKLIDEERKKVVEKLYKKYF